MRSRRAPRSGALKPEDLPPSMFDSGITAALEATGGDVRKVQKLSRHANLNTLMIYDDNRQDVQGEISDLLADLV